jgi:exonuclease SbcC
VLRHLALDFKREIESLEVERPERRRGEIEDTFKEKQAELKDLEEKISQVEGKQYALKEKLRSLEELVREIEERTQEQARRESQLKQNEQQIEKLDEERERLKRSYKELERKLIKGLAKLELPKEPIVSSFNRASSWEEIERLPDEFAQVKSRQEALHLQIQERRDEITQKLEKLSVEKEKLLKAIVRSETQKKGLERELSEMHALIAQGKCPVCQRPVSEETFQDRLEARERELERLTVEFKQRSERLEEIESQIDSSKSEGEKVLQQMNEEFKALEARRTRLEELKGLALEMLRIKEQGLERKEMRKAALDAAEALREELTHIKGKIEELKAKLGDPSELKTQLQRAQKLHEKLSEQKASLKKEIEDLIHQRGVIDQRLEQLKRLRQAQEENERELKKIEQLQGELERLTDFYGVLKKELRLRNIEALELYFNQFFKLMDSGASYLGVRVSEDYEIFVELKDGDLIRPELLSGGERALINIALRAAIHQVLSQAASRMPLILDEPTIYLDRERINRLQFLLEELGGRIGQVIVVSHEVGLVEGADHEYRTEKTADNTSRVYRVR